MDGGVSVSLPLPASSHVRFCFSSFDGSSSFERPRFLFLGACMCLRMYLCVCARSHMCVYACMFVCMRALPFVCVRALYTYAFLKGALHRCALANTRKTRAPSHVEKSCSTERIIKMFRLRAESPAIHYSHLTHEPCQKEAP